MSTLHQLIPLGDEMRSRQFEAYFGRPIPAEARYGRNPQAAELMDAFARSGLAGEAVMEGSAAKSWAVIIRQDDAETLRISARLRGKEAVMYTVTGDRDTLETLVTHLPASCGSYLISTDGLNPAILTASG